MKIKSLTLNNFRAFPGKNDVVLDFEGRNLLIYGENGSGKSSIFHALKEFFSQSHPNIDRYKNIFLPDAPCGIQVEFIDGRHSGEWTSLGDPRTLSRNTRIASAALVRSCLDYRALLDTNYKQGDGKINLFNIAVDHLLAGYRVSIGGSWTTIGELWRTTQDARPSRHRQHGQGFDAIRAACTSFSAAFLEAIEKLQPIASELLALLGQPGIEIKEMPFSSITYNEKRSKRDRGFDGCHLGIELDFFGEPISSPQHFLNEARLSALALAIYLAGRVVSVPTNEAYATRGDSPPFRLLVLDDVLIGVDHANRLPLLELLEAKFSEWQIVLLTYDRVWFEMARFEIKQTGDWKCIEIYEGTQAVLDTETNVEKVIPCPQVHEATGLELPQSLLSMASKFLHRGYLPAAANYTRAAYEATLKTTCHRFGISVPFNIEPRKVSSEVFLGAIKTYLKDNGQYKHFQDEIARVELFRYIVLNPYSHSLPWTLTKSELQGAMRAIEGLLTLEKANEDKNPARIDRARAIATSAAPTAPDLQKALASLRCSFHSLLNTYCEANKAPVPYSRDSPRVPVLWAALKSATIKHSASVRALLDDHPSMTKVELWLVSEHPKYDDLTEIAIIELLAILSPKGSDTTIFAGK